MENVSLERCIKYILENVFLFFFFFTENQPILTCICIGTAITTLLQNTVSLTPLDTGQKTVCTSKQLLKKEEDHLFQPLEDANTLYGPGTGQHPEETEEKQARDQKHQEVSYCGALYERPSRILQEHLQKIWCRSLLQGW